MNFQMFKLDLEKTEEPEIKLPTFIGSSKEQQSSRETFSSALLPMPKPLTVWITINCGNKTLRKYKYSRDYQPGVWKLNNESCSHFLEHPQVVQFSSVQLLSRVRLLVTP